MTRRFKNAPFSKVAQIAPKSQKGQNIYNKAQFESPKRIHKTTFETLQQTMFWNCFLGGNEINLLKQKVDKSFAISLGYFIISKKILMSLQKYPNGTAHFKKMLTIICIPTTDTNIYSYLETSGGQSSNLHLNVHFFQHQC